MEYLTISVLQKNIFTPDNDPDNRQFYYLNHEELAQAMGVTSADLPVIVDALGKQTHRLCDSISNASN